MDLSNFRDSSKKVVVSSKAGYFEKTFASAKNWLLPSTVDKRKERMAQYQDLGLFLGVIVTISYFQENISKILEIDTEAARTMM
jgi:hypothetical protein